MKAYHKKLDRTFHVVDISDDRVRCEIFYLSEPIPSEYCEQCHTFSIGTSQKCFFPEFKPADVELIHDTKA